MPIPSSYRVQEVKTCEGCTYSQSLSRKLFCRKGERSIISMIQDPNVTGDEVKQTAEATAVDLNGVCDEFEPIPAES